MKVAVMPGDGIGPEVTREAVRVLEEQVEPRALTDQRVERRLDVDGFLGRAGRIVVM